MANNVINPSSGITSGAYVGDSSANKAIAHGLGRVPKCVLIMQRATATNFLLMQGSDTVVWISGAIAHGVTAKDAINFYVGNAAAYDQSANLNLENYDWVAYA